MSRLCRRLLLALVVGTCAAAPSATATLSFHPAPLSQRFGVNAQVMFWMMPGLNWIPLVDEMAPDGIQVVRADAPWQAAQPTAADGADHTYVWREFDRIAAALAEQGLRWLPILDYSPAWAASAESADQSPDPFSPPSNDEAFARYVAAFVTRYGPGGSFWLTHPSLPALPVDAVEIWNEENIKQFWQPAPSPASYLQLYERSRAASHAVSPRVEVLVGGLANPAYGFLAALYAAGDGQRNLFDGVAIHPYAADADGVETAVARVRAMLDAHGDYDTPLDVTEFGWPALTSAHGLGGLLPPTSEGRVPYLSDAVRASDYTAVTEALSASDCGVERILPDTWVTSEKNESDPEDWFGIVSPTGVQSQTAEAYAHTIGALETAPATASATDPLCGRRLQLAAHAWSVHARELDRRSTACVSARASSDRFPLDHVIIRFSATRAGTQRHHHRALTNGQGTAVWCVRATAGRVVVFELAARRADFSNVPVGRARVAMR